MVAIREEESVLRRMNGHQLQEMRSSSHDDIISSSFLKSRVVLVVYGVRSFMS